MGCDFNGEYNESLIPNSFRILSLYKLIVNRSPVVPVVFMESALNHISPEQFLSYN
jgi:hypothetical protein